MDERDGLRRGDTRDLLPRVEVQNLNGEKFDESYIVGVNRKEEFEGIDPSLTRSRANAVGAGESSDV